MNFNQTWEIGVLMNAYAENKKQLASYSEKETLKELYAQAIELTVKNGFGIILPIDKCINWVSDKSIIDYDGHGYLLDKDGEKIDSMCCDVEFLKRAKDDGAQFVAWYNK